jgi:exosome complex exonuclease DIS3/RRP44
MRFVSCVFAEDVLEGENAILKSQEDNMEKLPTGHIVGIIRRKWRQYCGILQKNPIEGVS